VTATVTNPNGFAVAGDAVTFFLALANPPGACGTAGPVTGNPPGTTDASGRVALLYFPSTTVGFCEIIAKDSSGGKGAVTITQTRNPLGTPNTVAVVANPSTIPADGLSTSTVTVTVTGPGGAVGGDPVAITLSPAAICGGITPLPGSTSAIGQVTVTYLGSTKPGPCAITATEAMTNASGSVTITQAQPANTITLTANPSSILANGMSTSVITATVTGAGGAPVGGDMVTFSFPLPAPASCGTLNPPVTNNTNAVGQVTVTYTASTTVGFCTIKATEASGASGIVTITQHL
jgi:adhesin/invasin